MIADEEPITPEILKASGFREFAPMLVNNVPNVRWFNREYGIDIGQPFKPDEWVWTAYPKAIMRTAGDLKNLMEFVSLR